MKLSYILRFKLLIRYLFTLFISANPNVFNFYVYLRTHPLLIRQYLAASYQDKKKHTVVLSGFSYGLETASGKQQKTDRQVSSFVAFLTSLLSAIVEKGLDFMTISQSGK